MNKIKIKKLNAFAMAPVYSTSGSNGADIFACMDKAIDLYPGETALIPTGFSMELPKGKAALLIPRSGIGHKAGIVLGNLVGLVDSDYRGEVFVSLWNRNEWDNPHYDPKDKIFRIHPGAKIAQMLIVDIPQYEFEWSHETAQTERGEGGFGSTGS